MKIPSIFKMNERLKALEERQTRTDDLHQAILREFQRHFVEPPDEKGNPND